MTSFLQKYKKIIVIGMLLLIISGSFGIGVPKAHANWITDGFNSVSSKVTTAIKDAYDSVVKGIIAGVYEMAKNVMAFLAYVTLYLDSWIVGICGLLLNEVLVRTVVGMKDLIDSLTGINTAWGIIRDLGNMLFIFILLYAAIKTILGLSDGNTKRIIRNIIIVGLLVNFSLFFTKVLIDASNIASLYFFDAMTASPAQPNSGQNLAPAGGTSGAPAPVTNPTGTDPAGAIAKTAGFSDAFAKAVGLTSIYNMDSSKFVKQLTDQGMFAIVIQGVGGSIFLLTAALTFIYAAFLFLIRFVVLIILMMLSPLAYFGFILPGTQQYAKKWWNTLIAQLTFAPIYMLLMYITLTLAQSFSVTGNGGSAGLGGILALTPDNIAGAVTTTAAAAGARPTSALGAVFSFIVIIGMMIASSIIATTAAANTGGIAGNLMSKGRSTMMGVGKRIVGGATVGAAGALGRNTVGRIATKSLAKNEEALKRTALQGGFKGMAAKATLATLNKGSTASFDARNTAALSKLGLGKGQQGGFKGGKERKRDEVLAEVNSLGGASQETNQELNSAKQREYMANVRYQNATTPSDKKAASDDLKKAREDVKAAEKKKAKEIKTQRQNRINHLASAGTFGIERTHLTMAHKEFYKKGSTDDKDVEKQRLQDEQDRLDDAVAAAKEAMEGGATKDVALAGVKQVLSELKVGDLGKMDGKTLVKKELVQAMKEEHFEEIAHAKNKNLSREQAKEIVKIVKDSVVGPNGPLPPDQSHEALDYINNVNKGSVWHVDASQGRQRQQPAPTPQPAPAPTPQPRGAPTPQPQSYYQQQGRQAPTPQPVPPVNPIP